MINADDSDGAPPSKKQRTSCVTIDGRTYSARHSSRLRREQQERDIAEGFRRAEQVCKQ